MELLIAILLTYGMTNIIVNGSIFAPLRDWFGARADKFIFAKIYQLVECMMCTGFWVGVIVGCFLGPFAAYNILFNGCIYSGTCWLLHCVATSLGQGYDPSRTINVVIDQPIELKEEKNESTSDT